MATIAGNKTACERFGHAWYGMRFGGISCGRPGCDERRTEFCMVNGKPSPACEHDCAGAGVR